jgi:hypothetical protein
MILPIIVERLPVSSALENGFKVTRYIPCIVDADEEMSVLYEHDTFAGFDDVAIGVWGRESARLLNIPSHVTCAIASFLRTKHGEQDPTFNCYTFANWVKGVRPHQLVELIDHWELCPRPKRWHAGNVAFFMKRDGFFLHAAICLGDGLFVSVYGGGGTIGFSAMKYLEREFVGKHVYHAVPL